MKLAELSKIDIVPVNMIRLASGELCYNTKRIDRNSGGSKNHMIDFLQMNEKVSKKIDNRTHKPIYRMTQNNSKNTIG